MTHRTNVLNQTDLLLVLKDGVVAEYGPPNKVVSDDKSELSIYMDEIGQEQQKIEEEKIKAETALEKSKQTGQKINGEQAGF